MEKEQDLKFIKQFSKIKIADICKKLKIDSANLWSGRTSKENVSKVKNELIKEINKLPK